MVESLDVATGQWRTETPLPFGTFDGIGAAILSERLFAIGSAGDPEVSFSISLLDTTTGEWRAEEPHPKHVPGGGCTNAFNGLAVVEGRIFSVGGVESSFVSSLGPV